MLVYRNGVMLNSEQVYETDNYGYSNLNFTAGNYSVFFKANWHADDVRDYSLRTYFPANFTFVQTKYLTE
jgi:hypothetical protein